MIEPPLANSMTVVSVSVFAIYRHNPTKCRAPQTFVYYMVATNYALAGKHGVILHVGSLTSWTQLHTYTYTKKSRVRSIGGRGQHYPFY